MAAPTLFAFAGLPGVGKSTIARALAAAIAATYLRIDTIEQALRGVRHGEVGPEGYLVAVALATENLRLGRSVVADSVNPVQATRDAFQAAATATGARLLDVEIICSDRAEHRRRAETRHSDVPGLVLPDWAAIETRHLEPWRRTRVVIDSATHDIAAAVAMLVALAADAS